MWDGSSRIPDRAEIRLQINVDGKKMKDRKQKWQRKGEMGRLLWLKEDGREKRTGDRYKWNIDGGQE